MSNLDLILMSLGNLWRRKLRTFLTVLGVVIGTASIITTLSLGFGMKAQNDRLLEQLGPVDVITVVSYPIYDMKTESQTDAKPLTEEAVKTFEGIANVKAVIPELQVNDVRVVSGKYQNWAEVIGVDPAKYALLDPKISWGRFLNETDGEAAVFGGGLAQTWYNPNESNHFKMQYDQNKKVVDLEKDKITFNIGENYDPDTEKTTFSKTYKLTVVGETPGGDWQTDYQIFIPISFAEKLNKEIKRDNDKRKADNDYYVQGRNNNASKYSSILVKVNDIKNMREVNDKIKELGYNPRSNLDATDALNKNVATTQKILGGIGAVSLLVAAIGIANTMVMSIYERIKEIGIMKVIGASVSDIKKMFLTEAAFIGLFGGALGIGLSYIISAIINAASRKPGDGISSSILAGMVDADVKISIIPLWLVGAALIFATIIGIISGYYPARKATKLSPLEAIRTQ